MRIWPFLLIIAFATTSFAAEAPKPEVPGPEGQQAFDDLTTLYATGKDIPTIESAFTDLSRGTPAARIAAGNYLYALLKQSAADELDGRDLSRTAPYQPDNPEPLSRQFRKKLAAEIAEAKPVPELLTTELWLAKSDSVGANNLIGVNAIMANPSPEALNALRPLLSPASPQENVIFALIHDIEREHRVEFAAEIKELCNDPRPLVRADALKAAKSLGISDIPEFDAEKSLSGMMELQFAEIRKMVLTPIPKEALWKRFKTTSSAFSWDEEPGFGHGPGPYELSGWLLSQDKDNYHILNLFGRLITLSRETTTIADRTFAEDVKDMLNLRGLKPRAFLQGPRGALIPVFQSGPDTTPGPVTIQEALLAAWAFERGDRKDAADIILPCFDRLHAGEPFSQTARDYLANTYQGQMLERFTEDRDYPEAVRIARHLGKEQFQGWRYYERTKELAAQLEKRGEDFAILTLPPEKEWKALQGQLNRTQQTEYLAKRIKLLTGNTFALPYDINFGGYQQKGPEYHFFISKSDVVINPLIELSALELQPKELQTLLPYLDDDDYVVSAGHSDMYKPFDIMYKVNEFVVEIINEAACDEIIDLKAYMSANADQRQVIRAKVAQWIKANENKSRADLLLAKLRNPTDDPYLPLVARELAHKKVEAALPIFLQKINQQEFGADLMECCFILDPAGSLDGAKWTPQNHDEEFWRAMILFVAGDRQKNEGVGELKAVLATDGFELIFNKKAIDVVIHQDPSVALELFSGLPKKFDDFTFSPDITAIMHRLLLLGDKDAFDYIMADLNMPGDGSLSKQKIDGKEVQVMLTNADYAASRWEGLRGKDYEFSYAAPDEKRKAEREAFKVWLTAQFKLIQAGKPSEIGPPPDFMQNSGQWMDDHPWFQKI